MVDVSYFMKKQGQGQTVTNLKKWVVLEATVDTDDTITVDELVAVNNAYAYALDDGAVVAVSVATNVVTVTEAALTDEKIIVLAIGT